MSKMINCKVCGGEIASSAKVCPHCGAKNKKKPIVLIVIIAFLVIGVIGDVLGGEDTSPQKVGEIEATTPDVNTEVEVKQNKFTVGEKVKLNDIVVTLVNVEESKGSQFNTPTDGNVFALLEFEIENNSSSEIGVSSLLSFSAYCDDYALNYSVGALLEKNEKNQLDGTVAAGKKMNGIIGYEIPNDWNEIEVHFSPDFWSNKEIVFVANH